MMADWLAEYRLSANEDESSEEDHYVGYTFTTDDFGIQSDLIGKKTNLLDEKSKVCESAP